MISLISGRILLCPGAARFEAEADLDAHLHVCNGPVLDVAADLVTSNQSRCLTLSARRMPVPRSGLLRTDRSGRLVVSRSARTPRFGSANRCVTSAWALAAALGGSAMSRRILGEGLAEPVDPGSVVVQDLLK